MAPGNPVTRCHPRHLDQVQNQVSPTTLTRCQNQVSPVTITGEVTGEVEPVNIRKKLNSNFNSEGSEERGLAREEGTQALPPRPPLPLPPLQWRAPPGMGVARFSSNTTRRRPGLYERFMAPRHRQTFPAFGRLSGFYVSRTEQEAVLKLAAAEGAS